MDVFITPRELSGTVTAPASKSAVHRALICAALADTPTMIRSARNDDIPISRDIQATVNALEQLGAKITHDSHALTVVPAPHTNFPLSYASFDCESSGSTIRFILPIATVLCRASTFTGTTMLTSRPLGELLVALHDHGARFFSANAQTAGPLTVGNAAARLRTLSLPLRVLGTINPGDFEIPGDITSQYITGLLFALALLSGETGEDSTLTVTTPLESASYVAMTQAMLAQFGVTVDHPHNNRWIVRGGQHLHSPGVVRVEGDWSNAAVLLALAARYPGVRVRGLTSPTLQGDAVIASLLAEWQTSRTSRTVDIHNSIDLFFPLAVLAAAPVPGAAAQPTTTFTGLYQLRNKDTDRLAAGEAALQAFGCTVVATDSTLSVTPPAVSLSGEISPVEIDAAGDHRVVMAATLAAHLLNRHVLIHGAEAVSRSYPAFFDDYRSLGGSAEELSAVQA